MNNQDSIITYLDNALAELRKALQARDGVEQIELADRQISEAIYNVKAAIISIEAKERAQ